MDGIEETAIGPGTDDESRAGDPPGEATAPEPAPAPVTEPVLRPWQMPFEWNEFVGRWYSALDARDEATLKFFTKVDVTSERCGIRRLQRGDAGLMQEIHYLWDQYPQGFEHEWCIISQTADQAVVEWQRTAPLNSSADDGQVEEVSGIAFMRVRTGMLDLLRVHESPAVTVASGSVLGG